jgi:hypothetical protein
MSAMYAEEIVVIAFDVVVVVELADDGKLGNLRISARGKSCDDKSFDEDNFRCTYSFFKSLNFQ